LKAEGTEVAA